MENQIQSTLAHDWYVTIKNVLLVLGIYFASIQVVSAYRTAFPTDETQRRAANQAFLDETAAKASSVLSGKTPR